MARRGSTTELAALLASLDLSAYLPAFVDVRRSSLLLTYLPHSLK